MAVLKTNIAAKQIANTTTETTLQPTSVLSLPANFIKAGTLIRVIAAGYYTTAVALPTLRLRGYVGSTVQSDTGANTLPGSIGTGLYWSLEFSVSFYAAGATATPHPAFRFVYNNNTAAPTHYTAIGAGAGTVDTTAALNIDVTAQFGTANLSNVIQTEIFSIEVLSNGL